MTYLTRSSRVRIFADGTAIYLAISSEGESVTLQNDLHTLQLEIWEKRWDMSFNPSKCQVHNKDLKSTAYTTLVRPELEYASTVWSPHTATDIRKLEAVQRRSARWATRDYQCSSSVTQTIKDLNWRTHEQRRIDSLLTLMYKIAYDLVAIPAADYIIPNTRQSRHNHLLAYRQIPILKD